MILTFESTPFARSKILANGVGLFSTTFLFFSAAARKVNHFFALIDDEPYVH